MRKTTFTLHGPNRKVHELQMEDVKAIIRSRAKNGATSPQIFQDFPILPKRTISAIVANVNR